MTIKKYFNNRNIILLCVIIGFLLLNICVANNTSDKTTNTNDLLIHKSKEQKILKGSENLASKFIQSINTSGQSINKFAETIEDLKNDIEQQKNNIADKLASYYKKIKKYKNTRDIMKKIENINRQNYKEYIKEYNISCEIYDANIFISGDNIFDIVSFRESTNSPSAKSITRELCIYASSFYEVYQISSSSSNRELNRPLTEKEHFSKNNGCYPLEKLFSYEFEKIKMLRNNLQDYINILSLY